MFLTRGRLYTFVPFFNLIGYLDEFLTLNLNGEIYLDSESIDCHSAEDIELINAGFEKYGRCKRVHGPFADLNPGSFDSRTRQLSLERFLGALELGANLKAESMTLHSHFEPVFYGRHFKEWVNNSKQVWESLSREAEKKKVLIYIENSIDDSPRAVIEILKNHPYFSACFDVGHYNVFNPKGWKEALKEYPLGSVKEVHLSDNKGDEDTHLPLGEGSIDFDALFSEIEKRGENPTFTLEPHSPDELLKSLGFIQKYL